MKFWDASALVPLFVTELTTATLEALALADRDKYVWWGTPVECISALSRRLRMGDIAQAEYDRAITRLMSARRLWIEVPPTESVRQTAERILQTHQLRTGDALQLAAAMDAATGAIQPATFVCLDKQLAESARKEGFAVEP